MTELEIYFLHESVFEQAGKELSDIYKSRSAFRFLNQCVFINVRFSARLGTHISYTTKQIEESAKSEDYAKHFQGLTCLGENMAFPISKVYDRNKNTNLVKATNALNISMKENVKIVVSGYESEMAVKKIVNEGDYPLKVVELNDVLQEITDTHKKLMGEKVNP